MTRIEFNGPFLQLMRDYEAKLSHGQQDSFFTELATYHKDDLLQAVKRLPANEVKTAYKPFPAAYVIRKYVIEEQELRLERHKNSMPHSIDNLLYRACKQDITPEQRAFAGLCTKMIKVGTRAPGAKAKRMELIEQFIDSHGQWLAKKPQERGWLQDKLRG